MTKERTISGVPRPERHLAFLDVGHGSCAVVYGDGEAVMFDAPPGEALHKFLRSRRIAVIRHLVISHADKDHLGGAVAIHESGIPIEKVWILDDQENRTLQYMRLRAAFASARGKGNKVLRRGFPHSDEEAAAWEDFRVQWLGPNHEDRMTAGNRNSLSVVARLVRSDGAGDRGLALFPGDLTWRGYRSFADSAAEREWSADWLAVPHHGGSGGSKDETVALVDELLLKTGANSVFFSFGRNRYALPIPEVVQRVLERGAKVRCSQLSQHCSSSLPGARSGVGVVAQGAQTHPIACCAGSILMDVRNTPLRWPGSSAHDVFVGSLESPMCRSLAPEGAELD